MLRELVPFCYIRSMPRFTLRALFVVVTLVCVALGWIAWELHLVREREGLLRTPGVAHTFSDAAGPMPRVWALLGAKPVGDILVHPAVTEEVYSRLAAAFPEARIHRETKDQPVARDVFPP
jgi:hypothetical protein